MKKKKMKYRLIKILCIGIIFGALIGMLLMGLSGRARIKEVREECKTTENKLKKENEQLQAEAEKAKVQPSSEAIAKENAEKLASKDDDWSLVLINSESPLDTSYAPSLTKITDDYSVDSRIADDTKKMFQDAADAGMSLNIISAYRDYETQRGVFNDTMLNWIYQGKTPLDAYDETKQSVAVPGTSEHATGLAMDITSSTYQELDDEQENTDEAKWLKANCANYGYILRYPTNKSDVTGIIYEPWHFRYVGKTAAKEIMGQGAMHDNLILPVEPVGVLGAKPNVDLGNVPVMVSPLEVLDGCIHALTCIGPASKEMSRHYWREPLVLETLYDKELDLCGVIFVGSPQINSEKFYVSKRVGMMCEALDVDGAFVTTEGFGNNHIDFASHIEQIGMRGISVVGMSFCAVQGALVVGNKYMTNMVDNNKSESGIENEVLACNTLCHEDAIRALYMLKADMAGEEIKKPEKKWNPNVKENNVELISNVTGKPVELVANEQSLPMSQKRKEKYD